MEVFLKSYNHSRTKSENIQKRDDIIELPVATTCKASHKNLLSSMIGTNIIQKNRMKDTSDIIVSVKIFG